MKTHPLVTVITVVRNDVAHIEKTLQSVLAQTYGHIEYIVLDGASTDGTREMIEQYADRISYWKSEPDKGVYDAMNKGIALSHGVWVNFMNSGDVFHTATVIEEMCLQQAETLYYGSVLEKYWDGDKVAKPRPFFHTPWKFKGVGICHQTMFFPGDLVRATAYDLSFPIAADYDLVYRLWKQGMPCEERDVVVADYVWGNGISSNPYKLIDVYKENARVCHQQWHPMYWAKLVLEYWRLWRKLQKKQ